MLAISKSLGGLHTGSNLDTPYFIVNGLNYRLRLS